MRYRLPIAPLCLLLAACGPKLTGQAVAGRTVMITNGEERDVTIQRIVANGSDGRAECVDSTGAVLGPGRTYTTTFFYCDAVTRVNVETDAGTASLNLGD
jgi:hypothetical protein